MAEPMTLLDLDAAGLDLALPAPAEFIQFLYDNSRFNYLTLWSQKLSELNGPADINRWINDGLAVYYSRRVLTQMAPPGDKPTGEGVTEVTYGGSTTPAAPECVTAPHVTGVGEVGQMLSCTMGNWDNAPTSYAYQWQSNGASVGDGTASYAVADTDAGAAVTCVVTATNAGGSTAAPPSNAVQIAGAARSRRGEQKSEGGSQHADENRGQERAAQHDDQRRRGR